MVNSIPRKPTTCPSPPNLARRKLSGPGTCRSPAAASSRTRAPITCLTSTFTGAAFRRIELPRGQTDERHVSPVYSLLEDSRRIPLPGKRSRWAARPDCEVIDVLVDQLGCRRRQVELTFHWLVSSQLLRHKCASTEQRAEIHVIIFGFWLFGSSF